MHSSICFLAVVLYCTASAQSITPLVYALKEHTYVDHTISSLFNFFSTSRLICR